MIEDDKTVEEIRRKKDATVPRSFMSTAEFALARATIRITQEHLAQQLIKPDTGLPVATCTVSHWETGLRPIPLWVARRIRDLAEAARRYDSKKGIE